MSDKALLQALLEMDEPGRWIARGFWWAVGLLVASAIPAAFIAGLWFLLAD